MQILGVPKLNVIWRGGCVEPWINGLYWIALFWTALLFKGTEISDPWMRSNFNDTETDLYCFITAVQSKKKKKIPLPILMCCHIQSEDIYRCHYSQSSSSSKGDGSILVLFEYKRNIVLGEPNTCYVMGQTCFRAVIEGMYLCCLLWMTVMWCW